jgi:hypothetical protein
MARPKKNQETEGATEQAKPSEVMKVISEKRLKSLLSKARAASADVSSINGTLREEIGVAVEKHGLHKKVFSTIRALDRLEPEKLREWLDTFEHYVDISGLAKRAEDVQPMQFGEGEGETEEAEPEEDAGDEQGHRRNIRDFPKPNSVAAE